MPEPLDSFSAPVRGWFREVFGEPTPPQAEGWPCIQRGEHTLILAPTGSGKTLAAFLWGIDGLLRELGGSPPVDGDAAGPAAASPLRSRPPAASAPLGVRLLYISPLKALNNDIQRNLRVPLAGIGRQARAMGLEPPEIRLAVRSGDTPQRERRGLITNPPHILITTPESLYLLLTSPRGREVFRTVRAVIVDEIHTMAGTKRGVHLAVSLERLERLAGGPVQRIGLSATIRPLEEVARFLGGNEWVDGPSVDDAVPEVVSPLGPVAGLGGRSAGHHLARRPVTIVDAGYRKPLDLVVETVVEDPRGLPGNSVWPAVIARVVQLMREHTTTLIFANSRRLAERTADRLNEQLAAEAAWRAGGQGRDGRLQGGSGDAGSGWGAEGDADAGIQAAAEAASRRSAAPVEAGPDPAPALAGGLGFAAAGRGLAPESGQVLIRAHHGSMSREARLEMERDLKAGRLPALVGTSSLELGIDIGSVDLVVQLQSPKAVAQGLQRVGRSGHLVGETSTGRILPTHREDVVEAAVIAAGMLAGDVEPTRTPRMPLDVLAQQIVAMVSVDDCTVQDLYDLLRCAYPYEELTGRTLRNVLEMLAGRYSAEVHASLRPRLAWDRVNDHLHALPGSRLLATTNGGTIPDRGMFGAYLADGKTRIGELDEEFVFETRVGDTFMLGSQVWRVVAIDEDRVLVGEAPGAFARMPFWHGDLPWRPYELGRRVGRFRREVAERLRSLQSQTGVGRVGALRTLLEDPGVAAAVGEEVARLQGEHALDETSAWQVLDYVGSQLDRAGTISSDRTIVVEVFEDAVGDPRMAVHSPFGGRVNGPWSIALAAALRERTGVDVDVQADDDGILVRFPEADAEFPLDLVADLGSEEAKRRILAGLPDSAVFGARFRMNAARALLLPGLRGGRRTPFWLQRLRARDLLQTVRGLPEFPLVLETYRDCLEDVMDLPHLEEVLAGIERGEIEVVVVESLVPSPLAQGMLWRFASVHLYEWDAPKAERQLQTMAADPQLLQDILQEVTLDDLLRPGAVAEVEARLQRSGPGWRARTREELALVLWELGDLSADELGARAEGDPRPWVAELEASGRIVALSFPQPGSGVSERVTVHRWVPVEFAEEYRAALCVESEAPADGSAPELGTGESTTVAVEAARRAVLERYLAHGGVVTEAAILDRYAFPASWVAGELQRMVGERVLAQGRFLPVAGPDVGPPVDRPAEFVDTRALEQMHKRTLAWLRREVRPVAFSGYAEALARFHGLEPRARRAGEGALVRTLQQLRAAPVVGPVWERDVLPLRLAAPYDPGELDALCRTGEVVWVASGGADPRRARVRFFFRGEGGAFLEPSPPDLSGVSADGHVVYGSLRSEGALFLADLQAGLDWGADRLAVALLELVVAGLVGNDSMGALRRVLAGDLVRTGDSPDPVGPGRPPAAGLWRGRGSTASPAGRGSLGSPLGDELARRLGDTRSGTGAGGGSHPAFVSRPSRARMRAAEQRVRRRLDADLPLDLPGRWAVTHRLGVTGPELSSEERALRQARQLLARYGVVTRASLALEDGSWDWRPIALRLQQLEMRGEVRRGYFVRGLPGVQFAAPEMVDRLRGTRSGVDGTEVGYPVDPETADPVLVVMNACDPANLYGSREAPTDGLRAATGAPLRFARLPSTWLVQHRGLPVLVAEDSAVRITTVRGAADGLVTEAVRALCAHLGRSVTRVTVQSWDGGSPSRSPARPFLEAVGFYVDPPDMTWERPV